MVFLAAVKSRFTFEAISPTGTRRTLSVGVDIRPRSLADNVTDVVQCLTYLISIVLAAALVILRPSRVTWPFFIFALLSIEYAVTPLTLGILAVSATTSALTALTSLGWVPLTIFALRFPHDTPGNRGRLLERTLLGSLVVLIPFALYPSIGLLIDGPHRAAVLHVVQILPVFGLLLAAAIFAAGYRAASRCRYLPAPAVGRRAPSARRSRPAARKCGE